MATINNIKKRAIEIKEAYEPESVTAEKVGKLFEDIADVTEQAVMVNEVAMDEAIMAARESASSATQTSQTVQRLERAIENLPDGQAVSATVAQHSVDIENIEQNTNIGNESDNFYPSDVLEISKNEYIHVICDAKGNILEAFDKRGNVTFNGEVKANIQGYVKSQTGKSLIDEAYGRAVSHQANPEFVNVTTDSQGNILEATDPHGNKIINGKLKAAEIEDNSGRSLIDKEYSDGISRTSNPEYIYVLTDGTGKVLFGVKLDGDFYFGGGIPKQIQEALANIHLDIDIEELSEITAKLATLTTDVEGIKDTVRNIQPIVVNNEGTINNQVDNVDLVSENNVIHLANRTAVLGRGYKIIRQVVSPATLSDQFDQSNTVYDIRINLTLDGNLAIPANSTLLFNGGKFVGNGTYAITLNNTEIVGVNSFDDCIVSGTSTNSEIRSEWFVNDGIDYSQNYLNLVNIANSSDKPIVFSRGVYHLYAYDMDGQTKIRNVDGVVCRQSIDFDGSDIHLHTGTYSADCRLKFQNSTAVTQGGTSGNALDSNLISALRTHARVFPEGYEDSAIYFASDETELIRALNGGIAQKKQEFVYIDKSGQRTNDIFSPPTNVQSGSLSINPATIIIYRCRKPIEVKNAHIVIHDEWVQGQTEKPMYRYVGMRFWGSFHVRVDNISMDCDIEHYQCVYNEIGRCYDLRYCNSYFAPTTMNADERNNSSYVFLCGVNINLYMENIRCSDLKGNSWGSTGTNWCYNWSINRCSFSRIDAHFRTSNLYVRNSIIGSKHICYTGNGEIIIDRCTFYGNAILTPREDYLGFFDGDITIRDCKVIAEGDVRVLELHTWDFNAGSQNLGLLYHNRYMGARNLTIDNLTVETTDNSKVYLVHFLSTQTGQYISGMRMPDVYANNIRCVKGNSTQIRTNVPIYISNIPFADKDWFASTEVFKSILSNIDFANSGLFEFAMTAEQETTYNSSTGSYPTRNVFLTFCENTGTVKRIANLTVKETDTTII